MSVAIAEALSSLGQVKSASEATMNLLRKLVRIMREQPGGGDDLDAMSFGAWADLPPYHPPTSTFETYNDPSRLPLTLEAKNSEWGLPNRLANTESTAETEDR